MKLSRIYSCISFLFLASAVKAKDITPPFNVDEVIETVSRSNDVGTRQNEFIVDTNVVYSSAAYSQNKPSVAFDGTNYFVVWQDGRSAVYMQVYGARVTPAGELIDSIGIALTDERSPKGRPAIAFDGTNFMVVWGDYRSGSSYDIYGARVDVSGNVLDSTGFVVSDASDHQSEPEIDFDGTNFFVVWHDERNGGFDIYGTRIDQTGNVLDPMGIEITSGRHDFDPSVAFDGINYLVVWQYTISEIGHIYGKRVDRLGNVIDTVEMDISNSLDDSRYPYVTFGGSCYLVVWTDQMGRQVHGALLDTSAAAIDTKRFVIQLDGWPVRPHAQFDSTNFLVAWSNGHLRGARVDQSGNVLDVNPIIISDAPDHQDSPAIAYDGMNWLVVWHDLRNGYNMGYDIYGSRVDQSGGVLDTAGILISMTANYQKHPSVAYDGSNYLIVWQDTKNASWDIYGIRADSQGTVLDSVAIPISTATADQQSPCVCFNDSIFLVAWHDERNDGNRADIYCARVTQSGTVLDTAGIMVCALPHYSVHPSIASDGINCLIAWHDFRNGGTNGFDVYGARVNLSGFVLDPFGIGISVEPHYQHGASVAFNGTNYLVVWHDHRGELDIYGARVSQAGIVLDPNGIAISTAQRWQEHPRAASDGTDYFVVWQDHRDMYYITDIYGARVSQFGIVLDTSGIAVSTAVNSQSLPYVAFDSSNYVVVWEDFRSGVEYDLYGAKVDQSGQVVDSFVVSVQSGPQKEPRLASGSSARSFITYSGWTDTISIHPAGTMRIWGIMSDEIGVEENVKLKESPIEFAFEIHPNIIHRMCTINYSVPYQSTVNISVYDITGRLMKYFSDEHRSIGVRTKIIDVSDLAQGIYFVRLDTDNNSAVQKIILLR